MLPKTITAEDARLYDRVTRIETTVIGRLSELRRIPRTCPCSHLMQLPEMCEPYLPAENYYNNFWQLYLKTEVGYHKSASLAQEVENMQRGIEEVEELLHKLQELRDENLHLKKKARRRAQDINRVFACPNVSCFRSYGSELALKVHIKKKHPSDRAQQPQPAIPENS